MTRGTAGGPVRRSPIAGAWYPGDAAALAHEVEQHLGVAEGDTAREPMKGRLVGLLSPHAGLRYSGPVAAYGYGRLRGRRDLTCVIVGPSHRASFGGICAYARGAFETPLGTVPIDDDLAGALLAASPGIFADERPHRDEHSLEMQLPFLQHLVPGLRIVPLLMGTQSRHEVDALAPALASAMAGREDVLLVASSDLSHYEPSHVARSMDAKVIEAVGAFAPDDLMSLLERSHEHACGGGPMVAVMRAARALGADRASVLRYADSGDVPPRDKTHVVGYLSAELLAPAP